MSKSQAKKNKDEIRFLVIDDEIGANKMSQDEFIGDLRSINTEPRFAVTCEEAIEILKNDKEIKFCFLDCKLPKTIKQSINYHPESSDDYGIQLADEIIKINDKMPIIVFSGYVDETVLEQEANSRTNIVGHLCKDEAPEFYRRALNFALEQCNISNSEFTTHESSQVTENITFDYNLLSSESSQVVKHKTSEIKRLARISALSIIEIGKNLIEVKQTLPKGQFYLWAGLEFPWNIRMLNRFMNVYKKFNNVPIEEVELLPISVLYELAPKSVDDEAVIETIDLAKSGETISIAKVKEIKQRHSDSKPPSSSFDLVAPKKNRQEKTAALNSSQASTEADRDTSKPKQQILKVLHQQRLWNIDNHIIYNGEPNSDGFIRLLPLKSALCLNFSPDSGFEFDYCSYDSWLSLHFKSNNLESNKLYDLIDLAVGSNTKETDAVIVLHAFHEDILNIINDWYCTAYIVDPNIKICQRIVERGIDLLR